MSHADFFPWISKNEKELVNSFPQKTALLVCECFFWPPGIWPYPQSKERSQPLGCKCCHKWSIQVCAAGKGMVFKQFTMGWGIETRDLGSRIGYHFQGNWSIGWRFESRLEKPGIASKKYKKVKSVLFWLDCASDLSKSVNQPPLWIKENIYIKIKVTC